MRQEYVSDLRTRKKPKDKRVLGKPKPFFDGSHFSQYSPFLVGFCGFYGRKMADFLGLDALDLGPARPGRGDFCPFVRQTSSLMPSKGVDRITPSLGDRVAPDTTGFPRRSSPRPTARNLLEETRWNICTPMNFQRACGGAPNLHNGGSPLQEQTGRLPSEKLPPGRLHHSAPAHAQGASEISGVDPVQAYPLGRAARLHGTRGRFSNLDHI